METLLPSDKTLRHEITFRKLKNPNDESLIRYMYMCTCGATQEDSNPETLQQLAITHRNLFIRK